MGLFIKFLIAAIVGVLSWFMGIYLLSDLIIWKILLWALFCGVSGNIIYKIMRVIDDKYPRNK